MLNIPSTPPDFFARIWRFTRFAAVQGAVCLLLSLLVGLLQIRADLAAGKVDEFVGLYLVLGLWFAPFYWLIATPAHLYFYIRRQGRSRYILSFLASVCVVLVGTVVMYWPVS